MKKTYKFLSAVAVTAALCTSCSTDDITAQQQTETTETSLTATLGETSTRAGINASSGNTHTLYWHDNDQILVRTKGTDGTYSQAKFDIAQGTATGVTSATFQGRVGMKTQIDTYAVYPYNENHEFTGEKSLTFNLPSEYNYETVETGIFPKDGAYRTTNTNVPMLGTISDGTAKFKHLGGLLVIRIDKMPSESGTILVHADQRLSGNFTVDLSAATPEIATEAVGGSDSSVNDEVTFTYTNATVGGVGVFYLPVPTGSYTNLEVGIQKSEDTYATTATYGSLKVDRADIIAIPVYQDSDGTYYSCTYEVNGHKFIDLCLPSGTLWAETNVGADKATDYGKYYAWGEVTAYGEAKDFDDYTVKTCYDWDNYKYGTGDNRMTKYYFRSSPTLESSDDAAYVNWGSFCRMPSKAELKELFNDSYTTRAWTTQTDSNGNNINGAMITSKKNGKTIFLPAAGYYYISSYISNNYTIGGYWSNSLNGYGNSSDYASAGRFSYNNLTNDYADNGDGTGDRREGYPIRPVAKTYSTMSSSGSSVAD